MKTKLEEYLKNNTDRFNCRWLNKRDPDLWKMVVDATAFLPEDALPKQRCWHVIHDVYERPLCPVAGIETSWFENRYLAHSSSSARASSPLVHQKMVASYEARTGNIGHWSKQPEVIERKRETFYSNIDKHRKQDFSVTRAEDSAWYKGVQDAWTEEKRLIFGQFIQDWQNSRTPEQKESMIEKVKSYWTEERRYQESLAKRKPFSVARDYYVEVLFWTRLHWRTHHDQINPDGLERGYWTNHIDHIYSIRDGFVNAVPAEIIGHWTNLRLISRSHNQRKNYRSDMTIGELMERYLGPGN
jgi:hypothetical protein